MPDKTQQRKDAMLASLEKNLGVVTKSCKAAGIHRMTFYSWLKSDAEFARRVAEVNEIALDFAESKLHQQIQSGNTAATIFYLKCRGKHRGYVEKMELDTNLQIEAITGVKIVLDDTDSKTATKTN